MSSDSLIYVHDLCKHFRTFHRREGVWGSIQNLFVRDYRTVSAVDRVGFSIERGEMVGYIGPNGAGKSTTIKMLTGILVPTSGEMISNGFVPWKQRAAYVKTIGVVFGQRTQLWWDIAAVESFKLLRRIYDVSQRDYDERMELFNQVLGLKELLDVPVRKLSLGQRMRCDLAAALLHNPPILFLDEPTIGLDVVAKDHIRQFLRAINQRYKTTVLLTTHDLDDIEELCRRIMIIDRGTVLYDGPLARLKERFLRTKQIKFILRDGDQSARLAAFEQSLPSLCANGHPPASLHLAPRRANLPPALRPRERFFQRLDPSNPCRCRSPRLRHRRRAHRRNHQTHLLRRSRDEFVPTRRETRFASSQIKLKWKNGRTSTRTNKWPQRKHSRFRFASLRRLQA
jgi:ABC-2 type transport system ATP-binding protein